MNEVFPDRRGFATTGLPPLYVIMPRTCCPAVEYRAKLRIQCDCCLDYVRIEGGKYQLVQQVGLSVVDHVHSMMKGGSFVLYGFRREGRKGNRVGSEGHAWHFAGDLSTGEAKMGKCDDTPFKPSEFVGFVIVWIARR